MESTITKHERNLSALIHALDAVIALGAIGTATYLLWEYLDDESAVQPA